MIYDSYDIVYMFLCAFIQNYNTEMSLSMADKITILRQEFHEMDVNHDEFLTLEEINLAMDRKVSNFQYVFLFLSIALRNFQPVH